MAKVPYLPVPQITPEGQTIPGMRPEAVPEAFGGASARAMSSLGEELQRTGNTLFDRAIALQRVTNETNTLEASNEYTIQAGDLTANYMALQGKDRVDGRAAYEENLRGLRQRIRGTITNPAVQRMYDNATLPDMARSIASSAGAAAEAHKDWSINTAKAQLALDAKEIEDNPDDPDLFYSKLRKIEESSSYLASLQGLPPGSPQEQLLALTARSKAWSQRIIGLARTQPQAARKMLDENRGELTEDDYLRVDSQVRTNARAVGAANIADSVFNPNATLESMEAAARKAAVDMDPDDPILEQHAVTNLRTRYNQYKYAKTQEETEAKQTIAQLLAQHNPFNLRDMLLLPGASEAYNKLSPIDQNAVPGQINRYNEAVTKADNDAELTRLLGMATSDDPAVREEFLNLKPEDQKISQAQMRTVMRAQQELKNNPRGDPRVVRALGWLKGSMGAQLEALDVYRRTEDNKDEYDQYVGALQAALDVWQQEKGKPAAYKDVTETIGPQLIKQRAVPRWWWPWPGQKPFFEQDVETDIPEDFRARVTDQWPDITPEQMQKLWMKLQFHQLYEKPKTNASTP